MLVAFHKFLLKFHYSILAQCAGAVKYTDYISADKLDSHLNGCPEYDTKQSGALGKVKYPFIAIASNRILSISQIELNWHFNRLLMLNWIVWNWTVFDI